MQNKKNAMDHLKDHQSYPATKDDLVETCMGLSDFSAEDKKWFASHIPDKTYNSAEEVMMALGWHKEDMMDEGKYMGA